MTPKALAAAASRVAAKADTLGKGFARQLRLVLRDTERRLGPLVEQAAAGSRTGIIRTAQANRTRREIRDVLESSGYGELADAATAQPLDQLAAEVLAGRRLAQAAEAFTPTVLRRIEALKALQLVDLLDEGDELARALWQATVRGVFGSQTHAQILDGLADVIDKTEPQIRTLYDTSISVFGRQVEALQAGDDPETPFAFMGPADAKNRPFCREHVGRVYTRKDIDALDNGQIPNVFLTGGGYNCRHTWMEVSKFSELIDLVGTDRRIPEVDAQLQAAA